MNAMSTRESADILATALVPWRADWSFDEELFAEQVRVLARELTPSLYTFGTAGEGYAVTDRQFEAVARAFLAVSRECGADPMLGIISLSLPVIVERIALGRALGCRRFQLSLPSWGALKDAEVDAFFAATCGAFPDCRFHHYNLMRTKRLLGGADYLRLTAAHPNLVAVKCSTKDPAVLADLMTAAPRLRFYLTEFGYAQARRGGHDVGLLVSLAAVAPERARAYVAGDDARRAADIPDLERILASLLEIAGDRCHMDGVFDKLLYKVRHPEFPLRLLPPYASLDEADYRRFVASLPAGWGPSVR